jgi:hypothetical protein
VEVFVTAGRESVDGLAMLASVLDTERLMFDLLQTGTQ